MSRGDVQVVVTGIGAVTAYGWGAERLWRGLVSGTTAVCAPRTFDVSGHRTSLVAEVAESAPAPLAALPGWDRLSRADRFAVAAALEASSQAGDAATGRRAGVFFSGSTAGMAEGERFLAALVGRREPIPLGLLASHPMNAPGDAVARMLGVSGPVETVSSACASGTLAIGLALDALRSGEVELAIAGGADALCQLTYAGFNALRAVDEKPCRPFRGDRAGLSLGEGAGVLVLETEVSAVGRGAAILARVAGAGGSCDAHHMTAPHPEGRGAAEAIAAALADADLAADRIDFVHAHGTGTPHNDVAEWRAVQSVFGARAALMPVTSAKGAIGHLLGAAGAVEAVAVVECLGRRRVHPTFGDGVDDPEIGATVVRNGGTELPVDACAVSTNFAFGGANAALVIAAEPGT